MLNLTHAKPYAEIDSDPSVKQPFVNHPLIYILGISLDT